MRNMSNEFEEILTETELSSLETLVYDTGVSHHFLICGFLMLQTCFRYGCIMQNWS